MDNGAMFRLADESWKGHKWRFIGRLKRKRYSKHLQACSGEQLLPGFVLNLEGILVARMGSSSEICC